MDQSLEQFQAIQKRIRYLHNYKKEPIPTSLINEIDAIAKPTVADCEKMINELLHIALTELLVNGVDRTALMALIYDIAALAETINPNCQLKQKTFRKHMFQLCYRAATTHDYYDHAANTHNQQGRYARMLAQMEAMFDENNQVSLSAPAKQIQQQLMAADPAALASLLAFTHAQQAQLSEAANQGHIPSGNMANMLGYISDYAAIALMEKNAFNLTPSEQSKLKYAQLGQYARRFSTDAITTIKTAQSQDSNIVVNTMRKLFDRQRRHGPFKPHGKVDGNSLIRQLNAMNTLDDLIHYVTITSPAAIEACVDGAVRKQLIELHVNYVDILTANNVHGITADCSRQVYEDIYQASGQIYRYCSQHHPQHKDRLLRQIAKLSSDYKGMYQRSMPTTKRAQPETVHLLPKQTSSAPSPEAETEREFEVLTKMEMELTERIHAEPELNDFYNHLHNFFENKLIGQKAIQSGKVSMRVSALPDNLENTIGKAAQITDQFAHIQSFPVASAAAAGARFVADEYQQHKAEQTAGKVSGRVPDLAYLSILAKSVCVKLTQVLEKQIYSLDADGREAFAAIVAERIEDFLQNQTINPDVPLIDQLVSHVLTSDQKHCLGPGLTSVTTVKDTRAKFTKMNAEELLTSSPIIAVDKDGNPHYFAGQGIYLDLPPRRMSMEMVEQLSQTQYLQEVEASVVEKNSFRWQGMIKPEQRELSQWQTGVATCGDILSTKDHVGLLQKYVSSLTERIEKLESQQSELAQTQAETNAELAALREQVDALAGLVTGLRSENDHLRGCVQASQQTSHLLQQHSGEEKDRPQSHPVSSSTSSTAAPAGLLQPGDIQATLALMALLVQSNQQLREQSEQLREDNQVQSQQLGLALPSGQDMDYNVLLSPRAGVVK